MQVRTEMDIDTIQKEVQELLNRPNPYCFLNTEEKIKQKLVRLNGLHAIDMGNLSAKIAFECPITMLQPYAQIVSKFLKESKVDSDTEDGASSSNDCELEFCEMLYNALETKRIIQKLLDPNNPAPQREFLDTAYNSSLFTAFHELSLKMLKGHELRVAEKLALLTPARDSRSLCNNVNKLFSGTEFSKLVSLSFKVRLDINTLLLNKEPTKFFLNSDLTPDNYLKFPNLVDSLLKNKEPSIGKKLANVSDPCRFLVIEMGLERLQTIPSFKLIADCLHKQRELMYETHTTPLCTNTLFVQEKVRKRNRALPIDANADLDFISPRDGLMNFELYEEEEPTICERFCRLF